MPIDNSPWLKKRAHYTPDLIPDDISFASENYVINMTILSDPQDILS